MSKVKEIFKKVGYISYTAFCIALMIFPSHLSTHEYGSYNDDDLEERIFEVVDLARECFTTDSIRTIRRYGKFEGKDTIVEEFSDPVVLVNKNDSTKITKSNKEIPVQK